MPSGCGGRDTEQPSAALELGPQPCPSCTWKGEFKGDRNKWGRSDTWWPEAHCPGQQGLGLAWSPVVGECEESGAATGEKPRSCLVLCPHCCPDLVGSSVRREVTENKQSHRGLRLSDCPEDRYDDGATHCLTLPCHPPRLCLD